MSWPQIQVPFSGGVNESVDERHVPLGEFVSLDNVRFETDGSHDKRYGFSELTPDAAMVQAERIMTLGDRVLVADNERLWVYNSTGASGGEDFLKGQRIPEATISRTPFTATIEAVTGFSFCYGNGLICCAYPGFDAHSGTDALFVEIYDEATKQMISPPGLQLAIAAGPKRTRIGWLGTRLFVVWTSDSTNLLGDYVDLASIDPDVAYCGFTGVPITIVSNIANVAPNPFGAWFDDTLDILYVSYKSTNANDVVVASVDTNLVVSATVTRNVNPTIYDIATVYNADNDTVMTAISIPNVVPPGSVLGVIAIAGSGFAYQAENYSVLSADGCTSRRVSLTCSEPAIWYVGLSNADTSDNYSARQLKWATIGSNTTVLSANPLTLYNVALVSHFFSFNERAYAVVGHIQPTLDEGTFVTTPDVSVLGPNGSMYLIDLNDDFSSASYSARWVGTIAPSILAQKAMRDDGTVLGTFPLISVDTVATGQFVTALPVNGAVRSRIFFDRTDFNFRDTKRCSWAELGSCLYFNGARYDGQRARNVGYLWAPTIIGTTEGAAGGTTFTAGGTWGYAAVYERTLPDGTVERSAPSNEVLVTTTVNTDTISIAVTSCGLSSAEVRDTTEVFTSLGRVVLYRTENGGSIYYRVPLSTSTGTEMDTTDGITDVSDTITDADITDGSHPYLYTTDGTVYATTPPSAQVTIAEDNRLYAIGEDGKTVWFSQQYDGSVAPAYSLSFTFPVDDSGDQLTGIGTIDGRKVFFTTNQAFVLSGQGPSRSNQNSDYSAPGKLQFGVGCVNWRSIVSTQEGLWFQSLRGFEMFTRSFDLVPFQQLGAKVRRTLTSYPTITSAVFVPEQSQVRFTLSDTDDADTARDGFVVVYDTRFQRWTRHTYSQYEGETATACPVSAVHHDTLGYMWAWYSGTDALVKVEKTADAAAPWVDYTSNWIGRTWESGWMKAADLQGWQKLRRIRLLAEWQSAHGLDADLYYDYATTAEAHTYTEATVTALLTNAREQIEITPGTMKTQAVQFVLTDTEPATIGTGRGSTLNGLAFEVMPLPGGARNIASGGRT